MSNEVMNGVKVIETEKTDAIRQKGYNICKEYLNGAWSLISQEEFVIKKLRYVLIIIAISNSSWH